MKKKKISINLLILILISPLLFQVPAYAHDEYHDRGYRHYRYHRFYPETYFYYRRIYYPSRVYYYYDVYPEQAVYYRQEAQSQAVNPSYLPVTSIANMASQGIPDAVIISEIDRTRSSYILSSEIITYLKHNNVSDKVIDYMLQTRKKYK